MSGHGGTALCSCVIYEIDDLASRLEKASNHELKGMIKEVRFGTLHVPNTLMVEWFRTAAERKRWGHWRLLYLTAYLDGRVKECRNEFSRKYPAGTKRPRRRAQRQARTMRVHSFRRPSRSVSIAA